MDVVVLASGRGSNLRAIAHAIDEGRCGIRIAAVVSDKPSAEALVFAKERGIPTVVVVPKSFPSREDWDRALAEEVARFSPGLVVLAGFMRIVGAAMLARFPHRIVNVHPALLPSFPGTDGPAQAVAKGVRISGCTVHVVDAGVDTGPILAQAAVAVFPTDDAASLHARIQRAEHRILPAVIDHVAKGNVELGPTPTWKTTAAFTDDLFFAPSA